MAAAFVCPARGLPDKDWLQAISLLAHSVHDQSVVLRFPDGAKQLLRAGDEVHGTYTLQLQKVLDHRVVLIATHPLVSDHTLRLWIDPRETSPLARIVSSSREQIEGAREQQFRLLPPVMHFAEEETKNK